MKEETALLATVTLLGVLLQGDLCAKNFPRVAAAHLWPSRVRARLPSPGKLQRVLSAVPRHALGRRHLLPRRRRSPVRTVLPVRAAPLLPGIRALRTAQVTRAGLPGKHCRGGSLLDATLRVGGGDRPQGTHGKRSGVGGWAVVAQESRSNPAWEGPEPEGRA
nr:leukotriene C4 synthase isoform X1 [Rattus norvegicus]